VIVFPNAKINLGLHVVARRPDGFHNLDSCFYPVAWQDALEIIEADKTRFVSSGINIPGKAEDNLCLKAFRLMQKDFALPPVHIHLYKNIPIGAGLGGGSADAAFTLRLLSRHFHLMLSDDLLKMYAAELGSDCAFFINNEPAIASGKGDDLDPIALDLSSYYIFIVYPDLAISTKEAYATVAPRPPERSIRDIVMNEPLENWKHHLVNDFEAGVSAAHPDIAHIRKTLYENGALYAAMSGSGSCVYGIFNDDPHSRVSFPDHYRTWSGLLRRSF
jgi:4-diphosphocytidyl-2-C-methyl-D-erythritol kinase